MVYSFRIFYIFGGESDNGEIFHYLNNNYMLTHEDKELLAKKGISEEKIAEQLACFEKGFAFLKL